MAAGLPCVASPVGGIPELLPKEFLVGPKDVMGFSDAVEGLITNTARMEAESLRNIGKAKEYIIPVLQNRRNHFYQKIKDLVKGQG